MGVLQDIQSALETRLATLSPAVHTVPTNIRDVPSLNTNYIMSTILYANTETANLAGDKIYTGIFQVDVFTKLQNGSGGNIAIQDSILTLFDKQILTKNSTKVRIDNISPGILRNEGAWLQGILSIEFNVVT